MVFGGLIVFMGRVEMVTSHRVRGHLPDRLMKESNIGIGDSIAFNGVCLTAAAIDPKKEGDNTSTTTAVYFDLSSETLAKTTFGGSSSKSTPIQQQREVHIEPSLRLSDTVGGHIVSGHVHGTAQLALALDRKTGDLFIDLTQFLAQGYSVTGEMPLLKDSIAIDGVSLTVAEVLTAKKMIRIALIEHTMQRTLFAQYEKGQRVNVEYNYSHHRRVELSTWSPDSLNSKTTTTTLGEQLVQEDKDQHSVDLRWMEEAVREAEKGRYTCAPNPWVGAILVDSKGNRQVAAGHHERPGERHAERMIESQMQDYTLYCTLEPCSHHGRTPPCVDYLLERGPRRVVIGILDPDSRVSGRGVAALRKGGIEVTVGVGAAQVAKSLRPYLWHRTHRDTPYVMGKLAVSMDNCYAYASDTTTNRTWITGDYARKHSHGERAGSQRIVVGRHTADMDQPALNVRYDYVVDRQPEAVVSTRELQWLEEGDSKALQVLVEGGPELHDDLFNKKMMQEFLLYRSTRLIGLQGLRWTPAFLDADGWQLVETQTFPDGDTLQRFQHSTVTAFLAQQVSIATGHDEDTANKTEAINVDSLIASSAASPKAKEKFQFDTIDSAVQTLKDGGVVVVMDDEDRENEGDLMMLADRISHRNMVMMLRHTTGIVCATITKTRANILDLPPMISDEANTDNHCTKFTVTVDAAHGITTGVNAADRIQSLSVLASASAVPSDLSRPGHIFPLIAAPGGLLQRQGHTEAGVELARLAGMENPVMVISELYDQSTGRMMSRAQCAQLGLPIITVAGLKQHVHPTWATVPLQQYPIAESAGNNGWEVAIFAGTKVLRLAKTTPTPVATATTGGGEGKSTLLLRIHSECFTGDVLGSALCDCGNQLHKALEMIAAHGSGMIVFPPEHEGRGIGLENKLKAYKLQREKGLSTFEANQALGFSADARDFAGVPAVLLQMNMTPETTEVELLTENPAKMEALRRAGFTVNANASMKMESIPQNARYLEDKQLKFEEDAQSIALSGSSSPSPSTTTPTSNVTPTTAVATPSSDSDALQAPSHSSFKPAGYNLAKMAPPALMLSEKQLEALGEFRVVMVQAEWHRYLSDPMVDAMVATLAAGSGITKVERHFAPGSFELPRVIKHLATRASASESGGRTIYVAIGILVKGDTDHYDLVARESTAGIARLQVEQDLWIVNAILACHTIQQAADRCLPDGPSFVGTNMAQAVTRLALTAMEK